MSSALFNVHMLRDSAAYRACRRLSLQGVMIKHSAVVAVVAGMRAFLSQVCAGRCACHGQHGVLQQSAT